MPDVLETPIGVPPGRETYQCAAGPLLQLILLPRYSGRLTNSGRYPTHSTVQNGMSRLEPSRNTRGTWDMDVLPMSFIAGKSN